MRRRSGFTIVELLVSMALILFIMAILAEAFVEGLKTFRNMKAVGDMNARLRTAEGMLRDDLISDHFEGKRRMSDPFFWTIGPPREGFFRVWHGSVMQPAPAPGAVSYIEGFADGVPSYYATDHVLQYTTKKRGNDRQDFYSAAVPLTSPLLPLGNPDSRYQDSVGTLATYNSQWVEVAWFMRANGSQAGTLPLFTLYRRQRVVVPSTVLISANALVDLNYQAPGALQRTPQNLSDYLEVSTSVSAQNTLFFNSPRDLTIPLRRFGMNANPPVGVPKVVTANGQLTYPILASPPSPNFLAGDEDSLAAVGNPTASREGSDVILTDVISFAVIPIFSGVPAENFPPQQNRAFPPGVSVFDTWSNHADDTYDYTRWDIGDITDPQDPHLVPNKLVLTGLQISIRVWDAKTTQTRQITIIQDM